MSKLRTTYILCLVLILLLSVLPSDAKKHKNKNHEKNRDNSNEHRNRASSDEHQSDSSKKSFNILEQVSENVRKASEQAETISREASQYLSENWKKFTDRPNSDTKESNQEDNSKPSSSDKNFQTDSKTTDFVDDFADRTFDEVEKYMDQMTDFLSQSSSALLNVLNQKESIREYLKTKIPESSENGAESQAGETLLNIGLDNIIDTTSDGVKQFKESFSKTTTVMKSSLNDFKIVSKDLMKHSLKGIQKFFDDLDPSDDEDDDLHAEVILKPEEQVDVTVEVAYNVKMADKADGAQKSEQSTVENSENTSASTKKLPACLNDLIGSNQLEIDVEEDGAFSISCKSQECKQCMLHFYLLSQK